ncbi:TPA: DUF4041 domain-containing protein, partial [Enterococcus faecium]
MLKNDIILLKKEKEDLNDEINQKYDETLKNVYSSLIVSNIEETSSSEIKNKLSLLKLKEKEYIIDDAVSVPLILNKREKNNLKKKMLIPFDSEVKGLLNKLTISNIDSTREKIIKIFDKINNLFKNDNAELRKG